MNSVSAVGYIAGIRENERAVRYASSCGDEWFLRSKKYCALNSLVVIKQDGKPFHIQARPQQKASVTF